MPLPYVVIERCRAQTLCQWLHNLMFL